MARTPNLSVVLAYVEAQYGLAIGVYNCRRISGSQTYSQHSWSNAGDIHTSDQNLQDEIAADLGVRFGSHIRNILTWRYNSAHRTHIHVDMWPKGWLTPPCAGGALRIKYKDGTVTVNEPFPLTIKEEEMITDNDIDRITDAIFKAEMRHGITFWHQQARNYDHLVELVSAYRNGELGGTITNISDVDLQNIANAVLDEQHQRLDS